MEDSEYFKWIADAIIKNDKIAPKYKRYVFLQYKTIMANKKFLNKEIFLISVKELSIKDADGVTVGNALGIYQDYETAITIGKSMPDDVLMHELMHFVDYRIGGGNLDVVYFTGDKYSLDGPGETLKLPYGKLIIEGGAETNMARYNNYMATVSSYNHLAYIYNLLALMFGEQEMNDIYYSRDGNARLFLEMNKYGITYEEYCKFMDDLDYMSTEANFVGIVTKREAEYYLEALEFVSNLYNKKYGHSWADDPTFSNVMRFAIQGDYEGRELIPKSGFNEKEKALLNVRIDTNVFQKQVDKGYTSSYYSYTYYYLNGKHYISIPYYLNKNYEHLYEFVFEYDMVNNAVISKNVLMK